VIRTAPLLLLLLACDGGLDTETKAAFRAELDQAVAGAQAMDAQRVEALRTMLAGPAPTTTQCDRSVILAYSGNEPTPSFRITDTNGNLRNVPVAELGDAPGSRMESITHTADTYGRRLRNDAEYPITDEELPRLREELAGWTDASKWYQHEITHVIIEKVEPQMLAGGGFRPGLIVGRIAVYDYAAGEIACSAEIRTASSNTEQVLDGDSATQGRSLLWNLEARHGDDALATIGVQTH